MKTIEIGIDLGTTNSAVAICKSGEVEIIKNANGDDATPSIVYADKSGNLLIGAKAKKKTQDDKVISSAMNWKAEVKRLMGTNEMVSLPNYGKPLSAEMISAEILKSLISDVLRRYDNVEASAAVITVPAHFSTLQSEATKRAGEIAGLKYVILLQEPIAAAIAYGFTTNTDENWLVYDLGGGTFDVALVASRSGSLSVLAHGGDNFLGGKDIDAAIVDNFLVPVLKSKGHNYDYCGDANLHKKLRIVAEQGKIDLSTQSSTTLEVELDLGHSKISEALSFSRSDLRNSCQKIFKKTVDHTLLTIQESHVERSSIKRIVLIGGPTQMPVLREYLEGELGVKVDGSQDPLTVVAKGAALFAQQVPAVPKENGKVSEKISTQTEIEINFSPVTAENEQTVTGRIKKSILPPVPGKKSPHTICFQAEDKSFNSGDVILRNDKFVVSMPTGNKFTHFWVYLKDSDGNLIDCSPDSITISRGVSISGAPLPHSIGVSILALNASKGITDLEEVMDFYFQKSSILPVSATKRFYTVEDLVPASDGNALPIRVYEGESQTPSRNSMICDLAITGDKVSTKLKKGSPVDITLTVDESRQLAVKAYLPEIDLALNARATIYDEDVSVNELKSTLQEQAKRNDSITEQGPESKNQANDLIHEIESTIEKSSADSDQRRKASKQLKDLMIAIDAAEAKSAFESNVSEFLQLCEEVGEYITTSNPAEKRPEYSDVFMTLKQEGKRAIEGREALILKQINEKLNREYWGWMFNDPAILVGFVQSAKSDRGRFEDKAAIDSLLKSCEVAISNKDVESLRECVLEILDLGRKSKNTSSITLKAGIRK